MQRNSFIDIYTKPAVQNGDDVVNVMQNYNSEKVIFAT